MIFKRLFHAFVILSIAAASSVAHAAPPPTTYATWSDTDKTSTIVLTSDNVAATTVGSYAFHGVRATQAVGPGKTYFEVTATTFNLSGACNWIGLSTASQAITTIVGQGAGWSYGACVGGQDGGKWVNGSYTPLYGILQGDVIGFAVDGTTGNAWVRHNGVWVAGGNPVSGDNPTFTGLTETARPMASANSTNTQKWTANFGVSPFAYTAPSGFAAGIFTTDECPDGQMLNDEGTDCRSPSPPDGSGFAVAGMGMLAAGLASMSIAIMFVAVGALTAWASIKGWRSAL
jgi:hypothetical protein